MADQKKYSSKLAGSRILIIGGSSGIGFAIAEASVEYGALVTIASSNKSRVGQAVEILSSSYPSAKDNISGFTVDLSKAETLEHELQALLEQTVSRLGGKLDHVVFTAGDALATFKLSEMTMDKILAAGQIRFFAPLLLAKLLPHFVNNSYKSSYTITSGLISEKPFPDWSVVAAYAGGHHAMVRNLALDLKPLRVNGVSPGIVDTGLWRLSKEDQQEMMKKMSEEMATGRPGYPEDVAESFLAILRDVNMTGSVVRSDGGAMLM